MPWKLPDSSTAKPAHQSDGTNATIVLCGAIASCQFLPTIFLHLPLYFAFGGFEGIAACLAVQMGTYLNLISGGFTNISVISELSSEVVLTVPCAHWALTSSLYARDRTWLSRAGRIRYLPPLSFCVLTASAQPPTSHSWSWPLLHIY